MTEKEADVKNGKPGFVGKEEDGSGVWGYDHQIVALRIAK